jgi:uncharacterized protein (DUF1330 family)
MSYYSVLEITPNSDDWVADYVACASGLVAKYGGKYIARTSSHERLEGEGEHPAIRVIIEWPSKEAAITFMNDPEYVPHLKARSLGSISHHVLIEGTDDLA